MKRCVTIIYEFDLAIGKVNLKEIVYRLKELQDSIMFRGTIWGDSPLHI